MGKKNPLKIEIEMLQDKIKNLEEENAAAKANASDFVDALAELLYEKIWEKIESNVSDLIDEMTDDKIDNLSISR